MTARLKRHPLTSRAEGGEPLDHQQASRRPPLWFVAGLLCLGSCRILPCPEGQVCANTPAAPAGGAPAVGGSGNPTLGGGAPASMGGAGASAGGDAPSLGGGGLEEEDGGAPAIWEDITPPSLDLDPKSFNNGNYGMLSITVAPDDPTTVYLTTSYQGIWRSRDSGDTWKKINTGVNGDKIDAGRGGAFVIDPVDPDVMYVTSGYGTIGIWKSTNGGVDWEQLFKDDPKQNPTRPINPSGDYVPDITTFDLDPTDHLHLLAAFHDVPWKGYGDAGFVETKDGGATWKLVPPVEGLGNGQCIYFLNNSATWLSVSNNPSTGIWRTTNSGKTFTRVADSSNHYGACEIYRGEKAFYIGTGSGVFRSADNGASWTEVSHFGAVQGVVGDGEYIWASGPYAVQMPTNPTQRAREIPGDTGWRFYGTQKFSFCANYLAADRTNHIIYAAAWNTGALRLVTQ
jgi:photosystem II stability/assembly factor-like uncharacterized protein